MGYSVLSIFFSSFLSCFSIWCQQVDALLSWSYTGRIFMKGSCAGTGTRSRDRWEGGVWQWFWWWISLLCSICVGIGCVFGLDFSFSQPDWGGKAEGYILWAGKILLRGFLFIAAVGSARADLLFFVIFHLFGARSSNLPQPALSSPSICSRTGWFRHLSWACRRSNLWVKTQHFWVSWLSRIFWWERGANRVHRYFSIWRRISCSRDIWMREVFRFIGRGGRYCEIGFFWVIVDSSSFIVIFCWLGRRGRGWVRETDLFCWGFYRKLHFFEGMMIIIGMLSTFPKTILDDHA